MKTERLCRKMIERKRITVLCSDFKTPCCYGRAYFLAKGLSRRDSVCIVSVINEDFKFRVSCEQSDSLKFIKIFLPDIPLTSFFAQLIVFILTTTYLGAVEKRRIIIAHNPIGGIASVFVSKILRASTIFDFMDNYRSYRVWLDRPFIYSIIEKIIVKNVHALIFASILLREDISHRYTISKKVRKTVIPNGVDTKIFRPMRKAYARTQLNIPINAKIVLYSGAIESNRGIPTLLRAFSYVLREFQDSQVYLVLAGKGSALRECKMLASSLRVQDKTLFLGLLPHEKIPLCINVADVTVLPMAEDEATRFCETPLKLMEYMACGKPVVTTDVGNCGKIVGNERGLVVPSEDPEGLAIALKSLLVDQDRLDMLGYNAHKLAREGFSWTYLSLKLERLISR